MSFNEGFRESLKAATPARIGIGQCGGRYPTKAQLAFRADFASSKDAVHREVPSELITCLGLTRLQSVAESRRDYLMNTRKGRKLDDKSVALLETMPKNPDVLLITSCGLSGNSFENNVPEMLKLLLSRFKEENLIVGPALYVRWGRVAIMDAIGEIVRPKASLILIGERPGLGISDSLSGYFEYAPGKDRVESDRNVLSNIHKKGIPPSEAALMLADAMLRVLALKKSGVDVRFDFA